MSRVTRALISVSDKRGVIDLARALAALDIEILSTGGTASALREAGLTVIDVAQRTGFPEIMAGRVKTLHPTIHGGILGRRGLDDDVMQQHAIAPIDLVVVNLYPFERTVADPLCDLETAIENIDIGGPAMVRAAAKNHRDVAVVVDPDDYDAVLGELSATGEVSDSRRFSLAVKAFAHTARYDGEIANYLGAREQTGEVSTYPPALTVQYQRRELLRYGENPHQSAALYVETTPPRGSIAAARQCQGKALSYNNLADADAALDSVAGFTEPACVIVKHANPCGVAVDDSVARAYDRAYQTDPTSAFGGIIAINRPLDADLVREILKRQFVEVIIAPEVTAAALTELAAKPAVRVLETGAWDEHPVAQRDFKRITGGMLVQDRDLTRADTGLDDLKVVSARPPSPQELLDLRFAWRVVTAVKSNAIVYARDLMTIGIGAGQMSRVVSARIAALKAEDAGLTVAGACMASDAFFPFRDGIDAAAAAGITAVIQPGGSQRDDEVIAAANEHGMAMLFTGVRHFRH